MNENVVPLPDKLERLAGKIKGDLERREQSHAEWVEATIDLCADLAAARAEFPGDLEFGRWFDARNFDLNKNDRAAAIAMGQDLTCARKVLTSTKSRSLQLICRMEFRSPNVRKAAKPPCVVKPRERAGTKIGAALEALKAAGPAGLSRNEVIEAGGLRGGAGFDRQVVTGEMVKQDGRFYAPEFAPEGAPTLQPAGPLPELSLTGQQKLAVWQKKLEAEFEYRVRLASQKWLEDQRIPSLEKKLEDLERMLSYPRYAVMKKVEYNKIRKCVHPDRIHGISEEELNEATRILEHYKLKMINDEEEREEERRKLRSGMPRTVAEMLARKGKRT